MSVSVATEVIELHVAEPNRLPQRAKRRVPAAPPVQRVVEAVSSFASPETQIDEATFRRMTEALAPASLGALASDLECYSAFCRDERIMGLPATPETVARYIDWLEAKRMKLATVRRRIASLGTIHGLAGLPSPSRSAIVAHTIKGFQRRNGSVQRQAAGLRFKEAERRKGRGVKGADRITVEAMLEASGSDPQGLRDAALISVAYDAGLRVSELVAIRVEHIEPTESDDGSGLLFLPRSKTDQAGEGAYAWLSPDSMRHLQAWLTESEIKKGPVFRRVGVDRRNARSAVAARSIRDLAPNALVDRRRMQAQPAQPARIRYSIGEGELTRQGVASILRRVARSAADAGLIGLVGDELEAALSNLTTHSLRVGLTQDLFAAGEDVGPVTQALRWKSAATALRYARKLKADSNAAARTPRKLRTTRAES